MNERKALGERKRKGRYDPDLAARINTESTLVETQQLPEEGGRVPAGLYIATLKESNDAKILFFDGKGLHHVVQRPARVHGLCVLNGRLYDASKNRIYDTFTSRVKFGLDERSAILFETRTDHIINDLAVHEGRLYAADGCHVVDVLTKRTVACRDFNVDALCSHEGELYDLSHRCLFRTLRSNTPHELFPQGPTHDPEEAAKTVLFDMCSYRGGLWCCGMNKNLGIIFRPLEHPNLEMSTMRPKPIIALCAYQGKLLDGGTDGDVYDTLSGSTVVCEVDGPITAMCACEGEQK